jgi:uncharacterized membrane protein YfcA
VSGGSEPAVAERYEEGVGFRGVRHGGAIYRASSGEDVPVTGAEGVAVAAAGIAAGAINAIVGSGSLITFPTLLAVGYPAVLANVSNTVGLVPGAASGAVGYRRELTGQQRRVLALMPAALTGGTAGAALLLAVPGAFRDVVPVLILLAVVLVLIQPWAARRRANAGRVVEHPGPLLHAGIFLASIYGGYFGAGQGVIYLSLLGLTLDDDLQRLNGVKNILAAVVNGIAAIYFIAAHDIAWIVVLILVVTSAIGGQLGAHWGRRIPANVLRIAIAVLGTGVAIKLFVG